MTAKKINPETPECPPPKTESPSPPNKKAGFYDDVLQQAAALQCEKASRSRGLDDEICLMRLMIKELLAEEPKKVELIMRAINLLANLVKIRHSTTGKQEKNLGEAIKNIIEEIGVPLGVAALNKKL